MIAELNSQSHNQIAELHDAFRVAIGAGDQPDDPSNLLASVEDQLDWLRAVGFADVDHSGGADLNSQTQVGPPKGGLSRPGDATRD